MDEALAKFIIIKKLTDGRKGKERQIKSRRKSSSTRGAGRNTCGYDILRNFLLAFLEGEGGSSPWFTNFIANKLIVDPRVMMVKEPGEGKGREGKGKKGRKEGKGREGRLCG